MPRFLDNFGRVYGHDDRAEAQVRVESREERRTSIMSAAYRFDTLPERLYIGNHVAAAPARAVIFLVLGRWESGGERYDGRNVMG
jgi:hypothetical protein